MDFQRSKTQKTINFLSASSYNPPNGSIGRGIQLQASSTQIEHKREDQNTTYVYTDVENFRALVQQLTGNSSSSSLPQTPELKEGDGRLQRHLKMDRTCSYELRGGGGGKGLQRSSTPKLFERRRNTRKLEVKQLKSPSLTPNWSPKGMISPISILNTLDVFSEQSSGFSCSPLQFTSCSSVPSTPTSRFTVSRPYVEPEVHASTKEEPRLLQLFPLHSSGF